jgi:acetyl-CoA acetyltransferase
MGLGPVLATKKLAAGTEVSIADVGAIEMNEAFAARSKVNAAAEPSC